GIYLLGGVAAIYLLGRSTVGGWSGILAKAGDADKLKLLDFSFTLSNPHTVWSGLLGGGFLAMASHGVDQLIVQRLLSAKSLRDAQRAIIGSGIVVFFQFGLF